MRILLIFILIVSSVTSVFAQQSNTKPNILFILTDDENVDTIGAYGSDVYTPNIDKIAENGIKFTNAHVVHSVCSPSRYAYLTGRYYDNSYSPEYLEEFPKGQAVSVGNSITLEKDRLNIAGVLQKNGYNTGFVGKSHLIEHELMINNKKWEANGLKTYPITADPKTDTATNQKMKDNHQIWCDLIKEYGFDYVNGVYSANLRELYNEASNFHNVEWTADAAKQFIQEQANENKPFFLYVGTTYPHGPAPERLVEGKYVVSLDTDPAYTGAGYNSEKDYTNTIRERQEIKTHSRNKTFNKKSPTATWWDASVGGIIAELKATGQYENTIIIYSSDHGKANSGKATLYDNGTHVPLLIQWPNGIKEKQVYNHVVGSIDLTPTLLDMCNVDAPKEMKIDGISFKSVLDGDARPTRTSLLLKMGYAYGVRTDDWKYIAVRYSEEIEKSIVQGESFVGYKRNKMYQPYYMLHTSLSNKAANKNEHYFERNQLYNIKEDKKEANNLFLIDKNQAVKMKALLVKELENAHRPFGEFTQGANTDVFKNVSNSINYPLEVFKKE